MAAVFGRFLLRTGNTGRRLFLARCRGGFFFFPFCFMPDGSVWRHQGDDTGLVSFCSAQKQSPSEKEKKQLEWFSPLNKGVVLVLFLHMAFSKPRMKITLIRRFFGETKSQSKEKGVVARILLLEACLDHYIMSFFFLLFLLLVFQCFIFTW